MALTVTGQLTMPDGTPLAGAEVHLTAKRNEATSIVTGVSSFFTTGSNGQYSQQIESGYYAVSISYSSVPGADPRRWSLGDIWVEDGDPISINALLSLDQSAADPANAALQQMLADAQQARDEAVQAAQDAQEAVDGVPEVGTGPDQVPTNSDLGSAAYTESSAYASAAQGQLAEDAQPKEAGKGLSANDFTNPLKEKLESLEGTHWRGQFTSLSALESGVVDPKPGDYADVDVAGAEARRYIWDETDQEWVAQSGVVPPLTASQVKQLYESNPDTNAFDDEDKNKLDSIDPESYAVLGTGGDEVRSNAQLDLRYSQTDTTYSAGDGIDLSPENEFSVDSTVVRTSGNQSVSGQLDVAELFEGGIRALVEGSFGLGGEVSPLVSSLNQSFRTGTVRAGGSATGNPLGVAGVLLSLRYDEQSSVHIFSTQAPSGDNRMAIRRERPGEEFLPWSYFALMPSGSDQPWHTGNTTVDSNGFIKEASPILNLYADRIEADDSKELEFSELNKTGEGKYVITDCPPLATEGWYIEQPKDRNNNVYHNLEWSYDEVQRELLIETFQRVWNAGSGQYDNGDPVDIESGRFVALRFEADPSLYQEPEIEDEHEDD